VTRHPQELSGGLLTPRPPRTPRPRRGFAGWPAAGPSRLIRRRTASCAREGAASLVVFAPFVVLVFPSFRTLTGPPASY